MKKIIFLRGIAGIGKSTFIRDNKLEGVTLSTDAIRLLWCPPVYSIQGNKTISNSKGVNAKTFSLLRELIEYRMQTGTLIVIDATNLLKEYLHQYDDLIVKYDYEVMVVEFPNDLKKALKNNESRSEISRVDARVIQSHSEKFKKYDPRSELETVNPEEFRFKLKEWADLLEVKGLSKYKELIFIGDIHGGYTALQSILKEGFKKDTFYVFLGDLFDRGVNSLDVFKLIYEHRNDENIFLIEGNHEKRLYQAIKLNRSVTDATKETIKQFHESGITDENILELVKCCKPVFFGFYGENLYYGTHGGISNSFSLEDMILMPNDEFISGHGAYDDIYQIAESFNELSYVKAYNVFGHRNPRLKPVANCGKSINLNSGKDDEIRALIVTPDGNMSVMTLFEPQVGVQEFRNELINSELINRKAFQMGMEQDIIIASYAFSRKAFNDQKRNKLTRHARGMFINENINRIVCRGWEKFFNLNETDSTQLGTLKKNLKFPVNVFKKENGFLGLIGYDPLLDELIITSKSVLDGEFSALFKQILVTKLSEDKMAIVKEFVKKNNCTLLFEVIDPINDPHIVQYDESEIILLDIIENKIEPMIYRYKEVSDLARLLSIPVKKQVYTVKNADGLEQYIDKITSQEFSKNHCTHEGYVFVDANQFMFKVKSPYYNKWKALRGIVGTIAANKEIKEGRLAKLDENQLHFLEFVKETQMDYLLEKRWNIIELRNRYLNSLQKRQYDK